MIKHTLVIPCSVVFISLFGCSAEQLKENGAEIGRQYQCQQDNANLPNSTQREIECQQQARNIR